MNLKTVGAVAIALPLLLGVAVSPGAEPDRRQALALAVGGAWLPLASGLAIGAVAGMPISGKYEIDDGAFQLSVYAVATDSASRETFVEVIVDHSSGVVMRADTITDAGDLDAARSQRAAMALAKRSLATVTASVERANLGSRAVSVVPRLSDGHPVAEVTLLDGAEWRVVSESLD